MRTAHWLDSGDVESVSDRLCALGWLLPGDVLTGMASAGNGNLNLTLRVSAGERSAILKQARPWVERYPAIAAPVERSSVEASFYRLVHATPALAGFMPQLISVDPAWHILLIEDVGLQADAATHYARVVADITAQARLIDFLVRLHALNPPVTALPCNREMLAVNHAHIFVLPFAQADRDLAETAAVLGDRYLANKGALLHGDFFPEAWVYGASGIQIIDPEFCLFGPPEFDLGVMAAHLMMAGDAISVDRLTALYQSVSGAEIDRALVARYAGVEIWRRLRGVAPVSLALSDDRRAALIALAAALIRR